MSLIGISGKIGSGKDTVALMIQWLSSSYIQEKVPVMEDYILSDRNYKILDQKWQIKRFADKLKDIVCILIGCSREQLEDREFKEKPLGEDWWYWKMYLDVEMKHYNMMPYNGESNIYQALGETPDEYAGHILIKLTPRKLMQLIGTECGREILHPNIWVNALFADYISKELTTRSESRWIIPDTRFPNEAQAILDRNGILIRINREGYENTGNHPSETSLDDWEDWNFKLNNNGTIEELFDKVKEIYSEIEK